jgi:streptogramin lyase
MKLTAAVFLAASLTACSPSGTPSSNVAGFTPQTMSHTALTNPDALTLTGFYSIPAFGSSEVFGIAKGPGHRLWFSTFQTDEIGNITTAGVITEFSAPASSQPYGIAVSHSGRRVWSGGYGGVMISSTPAGVQTDYPIAGAHISTVVLGPDKNMWFSDYGNNEIGTITRTGAVTEFAMPAGAIPSAMTVGKDGNFWIVDGGRNMIVKMSPAGTVIASYKRGVKEPTCIVAAPDGNLYFADYLDNFSIPDRIERITTAGKITRVGSLPGGSYPTALTVGKDKNVYFTMGRLQAVGKITLATQKVTLDYLPMTGDQGANAIVNGPDGRLWLGANQTIYAVSY